MSFRPSLVPSLFVVAALIVLVNLGLWQVRRHSVSAARLVEIDAVHDGPAVQAREFVGDPAALRWRRTELEGAYRGEPAFVTGRVERGHPGFDVIQAFAIDQGPVVLVNRGWIPLEGWSDAVGALPAGRDRVHGLVLPLEGPVDLASIPAGSDVPERWPPGERADLTGCSQTSYSPYRAIASRGGGVTFPVVIVAGDSLAEGMEKPRVAPITGYYVRPAVRPHLEYAATWFSIGGVLALLWLYAGFIRGGKSTPVR